MKKLQISVSLQRISKNVFFRLSAQYGARLLALLLVALIARREGAQGLGEYVLVISVVAILGAIADIGMNTYLLREIPQKEVGEQQVSLLGDILLLKIGIALLAYLGLALAQDVLPFAMQTRSLLSIGGLLVFTQALSGPMLAFINGRQRMDLTSAIQLAEWFIVLAGSIVLLRQGSGVRGVILLRVGSSLVVVGAYTLILLRWRALPRFRRPRGWAEYLRQAYPFALTLALAALYVRFGLIILNLLHGEIVSGWYAAAFRLQEAFAILPSSIMFAFFPEMSRLAAFRGGLRQLRKFVDVGKWLMPMGGISLAILGTFFADFLLGIVFGPKNATALAVTAFSILVWAFPVSFLSMLYGHTLYAIGEQRRVLKAVSFAFMGSLLLNLILIPRLGVVGASLATLASEFALFLLLYLELKRSAIAAFPKTFATGGSVSARATLADLDGDGLPEIIVAGDALYAWRLDGTALAGFPVKGKNAFASQPAVVDWNGNGHPEILVGCDDDALYAFNASGQLLAGWPRYTGGDVFSSPQIADLDHDGRLEVLVGSDDGNVYVWRDDGSSPAGWPQMTQGFVSASPKLVDIDRDGRLEVLIGSWDQHVHIWRADGIPFPGWPQKTGHFLWSAPAVGDLNADGNLEIVAASDQAYVWRADGTLLDGWPQSTQSYSVASPILADLTGDGKLEIILASEKLYAWRWDGSRVPGYPVDLKSYLWSPPVLIENREKTPPQLLIASWNGRVHVLDAHGGRRATFAAGGALFASPSYLDREGEGLIIIGAWDGRIYQFRYNVDSEIGSTNSPADDLGDTEIPGVIKAGTFREVSEYIATFIGFPGPTNIRAVMYYKAHFETDWHPVPMVLHSGSLTGLVQPYLAGTKVEYYAESIHKGVDSFRHPHVGFFEFKVRPNWAMRIRRKLRRYR